MASDNRVADALRQLCLSLGAEGEVEQKLKELILRDHNQGKSRGEGGGALLGEVAVGDDGVGVTPERESGGGVVGGCVVAGGDSDDGADVADTASVVSGGSGDSFVLSGDGVGTKPVVSGLRAVSAAVRHVRFGDSGGFGDVYGHLAVSDDSVGFIKTYVKTAPTYRMLNFLKRCGVHMPARSRQDVALATYTLATVPDAFEAGGERLRMFALLGDRVIKVLLTASGMVRRRTVGDVTRSEGKVQSGGAMLDAAREVGFVDLVAFGTGVPVNSVKTVSRAVEAVLGVVAQWRTLRDVARVAAVFRMVDDPGVFPDAKLVEGRAK